ncbi:MAG: hypothetical protein COA91_10370 [Robiginitomaculum sp.]|nr:MAG: hypothetical protein COA91_13625 [Robiginitomaculum sp.]PHS37261.1 MAG: hypothetical protein COA91_10370 [Robiginitomaculum sp.]
MSNDEDETIFSIPYFIYLFVCGIGTIGWIVLGGIKHWPFITTVLIGAIITFIFRWIKTCWSNLLTEDNEATSNGDLKITTKTILIASAVMIAVASFWYGVGWGISWVWQIIF